MEDRYTIKGKRINAGYHIPVDQYYFISPGIQCNVPVILRIERPIMVKDPRKITTFKALLVTLKDAKTYTKGSFNVGWPSIDYITPLNGYLYREEILHRLILKGQGFYIPESLITDQIAQGIFAPWHQNIQEADHLDSFLL